MANELPLGKQVEAPKRYWPEILTAIARAEGRSELELDQVPLQGWDRWIAWEFAWRSRVGGLQVGILNIRVPVESPCIFESKSLKLYLNSFFYHKFENFEAMLGELQSRLAGICGLKPDINYRSLNEISGDLAIAMPQGNCIDDLVAEAAGARLEVASRMGSERNLYWSHLFRSLCPVTGQPDWATIMVETQGVALDKKGLLGYLLGFADHQGFHESCAEVIFTDIWHQCEPDALAVTARFTRRGGIEINPYRTSSEQLPERNLRQLRQ